MRQFWAQWLESFETHHWHAETLIDAGDNIVAGFRISGRGKASGAQVDMPRWTVFTIRSGLVSRVEVFESKAEALEAAGIPEASS